MGFLNEKRTIGIKIESTPYAAEVLAAADYNVPAYNISYDPEIENLARKLARGDLSRDISIMGKRSITITFSVDLHYQGAVNVAPDYAKVLQACAFRQVAHGATGISWTTHSEYTNVPVTIEVVEKDEGTAATQVVIPASGCMGTMVMVMDNIGGTVRMDFTFTGVLGTIADRAFGSLLVPTGFDEDSLNTALPDAVLSAGITMYGEVQRINTFTIDVANDVQNWTDPSQAEGIEGAHVVSRNPTLEMDPDLDTIANRADYGRWTGQTTGALSVAVGSNMTISAPAVQYIKAYAPGDREGHVTNQKSLELKRSSGDDELEILQGSKT
jgi:hypothetical protein